MRQNLVFTKFCFINSIIGEKMHFLDIVFLIFLSIILINQLYYVHLFYYSLKNIEKIDIKLKNTVNSGEIKYLILNRNYEISKIYYIYFVNFIFVTKLIYRKYCKYDYCELGD